MGISNLLKILESIQTSRHLSYYKGKRVAVDGYCWLHKSIYLLSEQIFHNPHSKRYLKYLNKRVDQLLRFNITPIIVFDGDKLQMKKIEEEVRQKRRNEVTMESLKLIRKGKEKEAQTKRLEGIDINPQMAYEFIKLLKQKKVEYYVAPYEADVQLAYLDKINYVDCVITEDSDLLALGCKKVLYKLDLDTNIGLEIELKNLKRCSKYDFSEFDSDKFLTFCILSGCDYFKIKSVGANAAYKIINSSSSYKQCIKTLCDNVNKKNKESEKLEYDELIEKFEKAFLTFRYQVVYCPIEKKLKYFSDIKKTKYKFASKYLNNLDFLGTTEVDEEMVKKTTFGEVDPITHLPFDFSNLTQEEKENVQENYLKKKRLLQENKEKILKKEEEDEFNLDINLDYRGDNEEDEDNNNYNNNNEVDMKNYINNKNEIKENSINLIESEENFNKLNLESTNTNSEHFINISDYYNENSNISKSYKMTKIFEPNNDIINQKKINYILTDKNKKIKISEEFNEKEKEKENINNENEKNDENQINMDNITKRRNTVLSGIDEFDDFLNSYDKVNQQLKTTLIKNNIRNIHLNFEGNKVSLQHYNNIELKSSNNFDIDKFKLKNN
jgi:exonuclease-1